VDDVSVARLPAVSLLGRVVVLAAAVPLTPRFAAEDDAERAHPDPVSTTYADIEMYSRRRSCRGLPARAALALTVAASALALLVGLGRAAAYVPLAPSGPALAVAALAAAMLAGLVAASLALAAGLARASATVPLASRAARLREKPWRAGFGRQRDPDAAGRPRPRAPSAAPAAAAR
jgi:hypothetical protein